MTAPLSSRAPWHRLHGGQGILQSSRAGCTSEDWKYCHHKRPIDRLPFGRHLCNAPHQECYEKPNPFKSHSLLFRKSEWMGADHNLSHISHTSTHGNWASCLATRSDRHGAPVLRIQSIILCWHANFLCVALSEPPRTVMWRGIMCLHLAIRGVTLELGEVSMLNFAAPN